ncbi:MAG: hypothetical protein HY760_01595, partial [Nitrospirae bacterium]|nr:hypothetical protein [Nitrospirota bacterium]
RLVLKDLPESIETGQDKHRPVAPSPRLMDMESTSRPIAAPPAAGKTEDVSRWAKEALSGDETILRPAPSAVPGEQVTETSLSVRLRVITSANGNHVKVERVEVAGFEPKEIPIRRHDEK